MKAEKPTETPTPEDRANWIQLIDTRRSRVVPLMIELARARGMTARKLRNRLIGIYGALGERLPVPPDQSGRPRKHPQPLEAC